MEQVSWEDVTSEAKQFLYIFSKKDMKKVVFTQLNDPAAEC